MGEIHHQSISFKKILDEALSLYKRYYREVIFISILISLYSIVDREIFAKYLYKNSFTLWYMLPLLSVVITTAFRSVVVWYMHEKEAGSDISLLKAFTQSLRRFISVSITNILYYVLFGIGTVFFIVPGILVLVVFSQGYYFALLWNKNPKEAFSESRKVSKGNRLKIFVVIVIDLALSLVLFGIIPTSHGSVFLLANTIFWVILSSFSTVLLYGLWRLLVRTPLPKK